jgi:alkylated DNA repair dioxygenase AlkB
LAAFALAIIARKRELESGSVFIMAGSSQKKYLHTIKKTFCENPRYSLTFREFIL